MRMMDAKERQAIEHLVLKVVKQNVTTIVEQSVATMVKQEIAKTEQLHQGKLLADLNQQKRLELIERVIRLEEGQRHLQEGQRTIIEEMNRRFKEMKQNSDRRFEDVIKTMELDRAHTDKRFEEIEKRFKVIYWILGLMITLGSGFAALIANMLYRILQAL